MRQKFFLNILSLLQKRYLSTKNYLLAVNDQLNERFYLWRSKINFV